MQFINLSDHNRSIFKLSLKFYSPMEKLFVVFNSGTLLLHIYSVNSLDTLFFMAQSTHPFLVPFKYVDKVSGHMPSFM